MSLPLKVLSDKVIEFTSSYSVKCPFLTNTDAYADLHSRRRIGWANNVEDVLFSGGRILPQPADVVTCVCTTGICDSESSIGCKSPGG